MDMRDRLCEGMERRSQTKEVSGHGRDGWAWL